MKKINRGQGNKVLLKNTIMLYILTFSTYFFNLITVPYQTRILGPEIFGRIGFCLAVSVYFKLFYDFGFILSATEDVSRKREDKESLSKILSGVNALKIIFVLISLIPLLIVLFTVPVFKEDPWLFVLYFVYVAIDCFQPDFLYRGLESMQAITIRNVLIKAFFTIMVFIFLKDSSQYYLMPILNIIGSAVALILVYFDVIKRLKIRIRLAKFDMIRETFNRSKMFFLSRIATTLYGATNTFILGLIYPSGPVLGYYSSSDKILQASRQSMSPISDSIYPNIVKTKNYGLVKKALAIVMPVVFVACVVMLIFADQITILAFGEEYIGSAAVLRYMVPIVLITLPTYLLGFPTMTPLGISKKANLSVIYSSIYHIVGIGILFVTGLLNLHSICILTITTELFVLIMRIYYISKSKEGLKVFSNKKKTI